MSCGYFRRTISVKQFFWELTNMFQLSFKRNSQDVKAHFELNHIVVFLQSNFKWSGIRKMHNINIICPILDSKPEYIDKCRLSCDASRCGISLGSALFGTIGTENCHLHPLKVNNRPSKFYWIKLESKKLLNCFDNHRQTKTAPQRLSYISCSLVKEVTISKTACSPRPWPSVVVLLTPISCCHGDVVPRLPTLTV